MNRNVIIGIVVVLVLALIGGTTYFVLSRNNNQEPSTNDTPTTDNGSGENEEPTTSERTTLVVYYSAQNHTKRVAEKIAENLDADTFELLAVDAYSDEELDWTNSNSRVSKEHNDVTLRDIELVSTEVPNWEQYDTVLIGYPIWWGIAAWPVNSFVENNDFNGKTVIPFCTSSSSGLGTSGTLLENMANGGTWLEGNRFASNPSDFTIRTWTDTLS